MVPWLSFFKSRGGLSAGFEFVGGAIDCESEDSLDLTGDAGGPVLEGSAGAFCAGGGTGTGTAWLGALSVPGAVISGLGSGNSAGALGLSIGWLAGAGRFAGAAATLPLAGSIALAPAPGPGVGAVQAPGFFGARIAVVRVDWARPCLVRSRRLSEWGVPEDRADPFRTISPRPGARVWHWLHFVQ